MKNVDLDVLRHSVMTYWTFRKKLCCMISQWVNCTLLRLGMLRYYLCTKGLISLDDEEYGGEKSDGNNLEMMDMHEMTK